MFPKSNINKMGKSDKKTAYICEGTCQAQITQKQYDEGLTKCGDKSCTLYGKPFKKVEIAQAKKLS